MIVRVDCLLNWTVLWFESFFVKFRFRFVNLKLCMLYLCYFTVLNF